MENTLISSVPQTSAPAPQAKPAQNNDEAARRKEALNKLNELLAQMIASLPDKWQPMPEIKTTPLQERQYFQELNGITPQDPLKRGMSILDVLAGTAASYGIFKAGEYGARDGSLGYTTTVEGSNNLADPLAMTSTVPLSLYPAYTNAASNVPKHDLGVIAGSALTCNTVVGDGIYETIDKMPANTRPLMAIIGLYGNLNPTVMPLADKGNQYGILQSAAGGANVSNDTMSAFFLVNLLLRHKKIGYLYNTATGNPVEKPNEGNLTASSWSQDGIPVTGIRWRF